MGEEKYWNLMNRYLSNELSLKETEDLLEWLDEDPARADLLKELQELWDKTKDYPENFKVDTRAAWHKLTNNIRAREKKQQNVMPTLSLNTRIAAIGLLLFLLFLGAAAYYYFR
ncbi:anti-sigma factor [Arcticibacter tournemirensis]|uniref:Anti-sigma factor n=1 Tax=Arcticibacter tournemirensis TaxID=699437 RepID=A0A4Q0MD48_9SPHI|nr:hypothetical protein [Arcticibacter tournemirensis]RXF71300.1 hypothetical protein EKH83_06310 [Arcticibacter tournemirensis]